MAYRNMKQIIENVDINDRYSLSAYEAINLCLKGGIESVMDAFAYGYALGAKAERAKQKKLRKH